MKAIVFFILVVLIVATLMGCNAALGKILGGGDNVAHAADQDEGLYFYPEVPSQCTETPLFIGPEQVLRGFVFRHSQCPTKDRLYIFDWVIGRAPQASPIEVAPLAPNRDVQEFTVFVPVSVSGPMTIICPASECPWPPEP